MTAGTGVNTLRFRMTGEPSQLSATEAARLIAGGEMSSEDLMRACLQRIEDREPDVGAWVKFNPGAALERARAADRAPTGGPFHGVPFAVKDIIATADTATEYGSEIYAGHRPEADASCVALMRAAGGVLLGKTVTTEFATFTPRGTRNPHNPAHTPGGSSSGSAAAVADFMVPVAFGSQTSGSTIRPASFCGVCAIKPTHGRVSLEGVLVLVPEFDCVGTFARSFDDVALVQDIVTAEPPAPLADGPGRTPRIGICRSHQWPMAEPASVTALEAAAQRLAEIGVDLADVDLPPHFATLDEDQGTIMSVWLSRNLRTEYEQNRDLISERLVKRIEEGLAISAEAFDAATDRAARCRGELDAPFGDFDALLTPSARGEAPAYLDSTGHPTFNMVWTLLQLPCVTIPHYTGAAGLPVGIQLIGRHDDDRRLLALAGWIHARL